MIILVICIILKALLFMQRGVSPWWSLVPIYNKIILGKLSDSIILGRITAIFNLITYLLFMSIEYTRIYINNLLPYNIDFTSDKLENYIPKNLYQVNELLPIILAIFAIGFFISWSLLMRQFSEKNKSNTWWLIVWAVCPIIAYIYFIFVKKVYYTIDKELIEYRPKKFKQKEEKEEE